MSDEEMSSRGTRTCIHDQPGPGWSWTHVRVPRLEISSSDIRARLADGRPVDGLLPGATLAYIREHDLYTARR